MLSRHHYLDFLGLRRCGFTRTFFTVPVFLFFILRQTSAIYLFAIISFCEYCVLDAFCYQPFAGLYVDGSCVGVAYSTPCLVICSLRALTWFLLNSVAIFINSGMFSRVSCTSFGCIITLRVR